MIIEKVKDGYVIAVKLHRGGTYRTHQEREFNFRITVDFEFGVNIPATGDINDPESLKVLTDAIILAGKLLTREISID